MNVYVQPCVYALVSLFIYCPSGLWLALAYQVSFDHALCALLSMHPCACLPFFCFLQGLVALATRCPHFLPAWYFDGVIPHIWACFVHLHVAVNRVSWPYAWCKCSYIVFLVQMREFLVTTRSAVALFLSFLVYACWWHLFLGFVVGSYVLLPLFDRCTYLIRVVRTNIFVRSHGR